MATYYVSSVSGDGSDGTTWAKAYLTVTAALAAATGAGPHTLYVDSAHAVTAVAAITWSVATSGAWVAIISVDRNGSVTTGHNGWLAGAAESVGAFSAAFTIAGGSVTSNFWLWGLTCNGGTTTNSSCDVIIPGSTVVSHIVATNCRFQINSTHTSAMFQVGNNSSSGTLRLYDSVIQIKNSATTGGIFFNRLDIVQFQNISITYFGANKPTTLFQFADQPPTQIEIIDSDLSGFNSGNYIDVAALHRASVLLSRCKLSATPGLVTGTWPATSSSSITLLLTDSGDTHNVFEYRNRLGTLTENNSIYRDNGAKFDAAGVSWEVVTTALCSEQDPFILPWIHRWHDGTSSVALGVEITFDNAANLTNRECWGVFDVLENASFPLGTISSTRFATPFEGTGANLTSSSEAWTGTGGFANAKKRVLSVTRTPAEKATLRARLAFGIASWTGYVDPVLTIAGLTANPPTRWFVDGAINTEAAASGGGGAWGSYG